MGDAERISVFFCMRWVADIRFLTVERIPDDSIRITPLAMRHGEHAAQFWAATPEAWLLNQAVELSCPALDHNARLSLVKFGGAMQTINIHEAKTHLSRLLEQVAEGEEIVIAKAGKPIARLVPLEAAPKKRRLGLLKGKLNVPDDFDAPLTDDELALFEGR